MLVFMVPSYDFKYFELPFSKSPKRKWLTIPRLFP